jgi:hypothetical protein
VLSSSSIPYSTWTLLGYGISIIKSRVFYDSAREACLIKGYELLLFSYPNPSTTAASLRARSAAMLADAAAARSAVSLLA